MDGSSPEAAPPVPGKPRLTQSAAASVFVLLTALLLLALTIAFFLLSRRAIDGNLQRLLVVCATLGSACMCVAGIVVSVMDLVRRVRRRP